MYTREDNIIPIIMHCKWTNGKVKEFRSNLGFKQHGITMSKEQSMTTKIIKLFANVKILLQNSALGC